MSLVVLSPQSVLELTWLESLVDGRTWLLVPIILVASYLLARLVHTGSRRYLTRSSAETSFGRAVFSEIHTPLAVTIGLLGTPAGPARCVSRGRIGDPPGGRLGWVDRRRRVHGDAGWSPAALSPDVRSLTGGNGV